MTKNINFLIMSTTQSYQLQSIPYKFSLYEVYFKIVQFFISQREYRNLLFYSKNFKNLKFARVKSL